jgi:hypothetical protein
MAKSCFFAHPGDLSNGSVLRRNAPFFKAHFQSTRGRGSWGPNGRSQSTGLQAFLGFPGQPALIAGCSFRRRRSRQKSD